MSLTDELLSERERDAENWKTDRSVENIQTEAQRKK